jgi:hypothetical protein
MKLYIEKESQVEGIKKVFSAFYPFLKIEFFKKPLRPNGSSAKNEIISPKMALVQLAKVPGRKGIDISQHRTVKELENDFESLGLFAEVFRKSGRVWVETSLTNDWTLQQQNFEGEEITRGV